MKPFITVLLMLYSHTLLAWDPYTYLNYLQDLKVAENSVMALQNQMQQIQQQLQLIKLATQNTKSISHYTWNDLNGLIQKLDQTTQTDQALSYAVNNIQSQFQSTYPNYYQVKPSHYITTTKTWHTRTLTTLQQSLIALHQNAQHIQQEQKLIQQLHQQGNLATGQLQALQVLSELSAENINQLATLKRTLMILINLQSAYSAYQVSKASYETAQLNQLIETNTHLPDNEEDSRLGFIPHF